MPHSLTRPPGSRLARLGPSRSCIIDDCRRSSQVRIEAMPGPSTSISSTTLISGGDDAVKPTLP